MANKTLMLKYYTDPGHGWCAIKISKLVELGIADKISTYSYIRGATAYLEEDADMYRLINTLKSKNIEYDFKTTNTNKSSPIRSYDSFTPNNLLAARAGA